MNYLFKFDAVKKLTYSKFLSYNFFFSLKIVKFKQLLYTKFKGVSIHIKNSRF